VVGATAWADRAKTGAQNTLKPSAPRADSPHQAGFGRSKQLPQNTGYCALIERLFKHLLIPDSYMGLFVLFGMLDYAKYSLLDE